MRIAAASSTHVIVRAASGTDSPASPSSNIPVHRPVLVDEVLRHLQARAGSVLVDCTLGPGGHAERLLEAIAPDGRLVGIDRDPVAIARASERLSRFGDRFLPVRSDFREIRRVLEAFGIEEVDGICADLGVSSLQMLDPSRGFGFSSDGPLDMRMDTGAGESAADLLARIDEDELVRLLRSNGEEPRARAIGRAIVRAREEAPIRTTSQLAGIVSGAAIVRGRPRIHPATRTFMALRIAVNDELSGLDRFIEEATGCLGPGGRIAVIAFHSLEDRIVKHTLRGLAHRCTCPKGLPVCGCGRPDLVRLVTKKAVRPNTAEVSANPRSRSARLRAAERI